MVGTADLRYPKAAYGKACLWLFNRNLNNDCISRTCTGNGALKREAAKFGRCSLEEVFRWWSERSTDAPQVLSPVAGVISAEELGIASTNAGVVGAAAGAVCPKLKPRARASR